MFRKYETPPESGSNFVVLSLKEPHRIGRKLKDYPTPPKTATYHYFEGPHTGDSTTVLWSGKQGKNTPLSLYGEGGSLYTGYICDPRKLHVEQADFIASGSLGAKEKEVNKREFFHNKKASKYRNKKGYRRPGGFTTNIAKFYKRAGSTAQYPQSSYSETGSLDIVARNVWRRFFKYGEDVSKYVRRGYLGLSQKQIIQGLDKRRRSYNEAVAYRNSDANPIDGLLFVVDRADKVDDKTKEHFATLLKENPKLKLYFYNKNSDTHIMRVMRNKDAQQFLTTNNTLIEGYASAKPFKGYGFTPNPIKKNSFSMEKLDQYIKDRELIDSQYTSLASKNDKDGAAIYSKDAKLNAARALKQLANTLKKNPDLDPMEEIKALRKEHRALTNGIWHTGKLNKIFKGFKAYVKKVYGVKKKKSKRPIWSTTKVKGKRNLTQQQNRDHGHDNKLGM